MRSDSAGAAGLALLLLAGCTGGEERGLAFAVADSAGVEVAANGPPASGLERWSLAEPPELDLGSVEVGGATEFFRIGDARLLPGGGLAVVNEGSGEVRVFDASGTPVRALGGEGAGGAVGLLSFVRPVGDSLLVFERTTGSVLLFDGAGALARSVRLDARPGIVVPVGLRGGRLVVFSGSSAEALGGEGTHVDTVLVVEHARDGSVADSLGRHPHSARFVRLEGGRPVTVALPFVAWATFELWGDLLCRALGPEADVRCYGPGGELRRVVRVREAPRPVREEDVEAFWTRQLSAAEPARRAALRRLRAVLPFPEAFPAFSGLLADGDGRLWARRYRTPGEEGWTWWVFSPEGRLEGEVQVPGPTRILDVRDGRVLTAVRDEVGIERVRLHALAGVGGPAH